MALPTTYGTALKHQVVQEYLGGATLHDLARRHYVPRNLIRIWVDQHVYPTKSGDLCEAAPLDTIASLADTIHECESRIETIERLVAKRVRERERAQAAKNPGEQGGAPTTDAADPPPPPAGGSSD